MTPSLTLAELFFDPLSRGAMWGCLLMGIASGLLGTLLYVKKECLIGEVLSHACYPGVMLGVLCFSTSLTFFASLGLELSILGGAFLSSLLGIGLLELLKKNYALSEDSALTFTLSGFFAGGIFLSSILQFTHTAWYKKGQAFLLGQAATMTDFHIFLYGALTLLTLLFILLKYREIHSWYFDVNFSTLLGIKGKYLDFWVFFLLLFAVVAGIRCVGLLLMSGLFITPVVAARHLSRSLSTFFLLSAFLGGLSGCMGNYFSIALSEEFSQGASRSFSFPSGPMILLSSSILTFLILLFSPKAGFFVRAYRMGLFRYQCVRENMSKTLWKLGPEVSYEKLRQYGVSRFFLKLVLWDLTQKKELLFQKGSYQLTEKGKKKALKIIRLHRLWEVYLYQQLGMGQKLIHRNAEMIEHILTPDIEDKLAQLLENPKYDPHLSPIPSIEETR